MLLVAIAMLLELRPDEQVSESPHGICEHLPSLLCRKERLPFHSEQPPRREDSHRLVPDRATQQKPPWPCPGHPSGPRTSPHFPLPVR
jgi:hypothetical protein